MNRRGFLGMMTLGAVGSVLAVGASAPQQEQESIEFAHTDTVGQLTIKPGAIIIHSVPMMSEELIAEQVQRALADMFSEV